MTFIYLIAFLVETAMTFPRSFTFFTLGNLSKLHLATGKIIRCRFPFFFVKGMCEILCK